MTLRPFKIVSTKSFIIRIQDHRGTDLIVDKSIKIPHKFWKKLLSYSITAFGYELGIQVDVKFKINPKFDRTDVIKALDFWIEHWVYQNKKDYILEGTVNKDFELTVRELIETREAVLKCPVDTKFVRQKIRSNPDFSFEREYGLTFTDGKKYEPDPNKIVEFTENVLTGGNTSASTVDQFCYKVKTMTRKEYEDTIKKIPEQAQKAANSINRMISGMIEANRMFSFEERMWGARHSDNSGRTVPAEDGTNPNNWVVVDGSIDSPNTFRIVNTDGVNIAGGFNTRVSAELYLTNVRERFLPSEVSVPTEQEIRTIIERGRLLGLNERQIRDSIELMRDKKEEEDN